MACEVFACEVKEILDNFFLSEPPPPGWTSRSNRSLSGQLQRPPTRKAPKPQAEPNFTAQVKETVALAEDGGQPAPRTEAAEAKTTMPKATDEDTKQAVSVVLEVGACLPPRSPQFKWRPRPSPRPTQSPPQGLVHSRMYPTPRQQPRAWSPKPGAQGLQQLKTG